MEIKLEPKHKIIICCIFAFLLLDTVVLGFRYASNRYSRAGLLFDNSSLPAQSMKAFNREAASSRIVKPGYAYYGFTPDEQQLFNEYYNRSGSVCVSVRIGVKNVSSKKYERVLSSEKIFYFGFLGKNDFSEKGKFVPHSKRILSGCDLRSFIKNQKGISYFDNGFAIEKNLKEDELPAGFVVYSEYPVKIIDFLVTEAKVGYDLTAEIPFFGVSSNGGSFAGNLSSIDFSGCSNVFPVENTRYSVMPVLELGFAETSDCGTYDKQLMVKLNAGGDKLTIRRNKDVGQCVIQTSTMTMPFSSYEFSENGSLISKIIMRPNSRILLPEDVSKVTVPLKTDPGLILTSKSSCWRTKDYEVYEWDRFPGILFFDTSDYKVQSDFFRRLAFFAEKTGFRGRILTDEELGDMHGYNAHDYSAETLAKFFSKAEKSGAKLTEKELILKDILLKNGLIIPDNYAYKGGSGAVISISRESPAYLRQSFIAHEAWHGIFFTNEDFRNTVAAVYYTVDSDTLTFMKGFWASQPGLGYDPSDEYLMNNEFMAYLMQQPLEGVASYFVHCANRGSVINFQPDLCAWVRSTGGITFEDACNVLNTYVFDRWGLASGRVSLITR